jgi:hypothetical protein
MDAASLLTPWDAQAASLFIKSLRRQIRRRRQRGALQETNIREGPATRPGQRTNDPPAAENACAGIPPQDNVLPPSN